MDQESIVETVTSRDDYNSGSIKKASFRVVKQSAQKDKQDDKIDSDLSRDDSYDFAQSESDAGNHIANSANLGKDFVQQSIQIKGNMYLKVKIRLDTSSAFKHATVSIGNED